MPGVIVAVLVVIVVGPQVGDSFGEVEGGGKEVGDEKED